MTSRGPLVKKHFPFHTGNSIQKRDSAIAETDWHYIPLEI